MAYSLNCGRPYYLLSLPEPFVNGFKNMQYEQMLGFTWLFPAQQPVEGSGLLSSH